MAAFVDVRLLEVFPGLTLQPLFDGLPVEQLMDLLDAVRPLYVHLLKRHPDAAGLKSWTDHVVADGGNPTRMSRGIANSVEYRNREIHEAYQLVFGRNADKGGVTSWRTGVEHGQVVLDDLPVSLMASNEFYQRSDGTDEGFVRGMYRTILGREVDAAGLRSWTDVARTQGRTAALRGVWDSYEATARRVGGLYVEYLGRGTDPTGRHTWTLRAQQLGDDRVRDQLILSREYISRAYARH